MKNRALIIIDIQNDITKNYRTIIDKINLAIDWACEMNMRVVYLKHNNLTSGTSFKPNSHGSELVSEMKIVSEFIFIKTKGNALTSEEFTKFINDYEINEFFIAGADAVGCVKSTCLNMRKENYDVCVLSDCIVSYDMKKIPEMLTYYESKGCIVRKLDEVVKHN